VRFTSDVFHPNVYSDGTLCMDVLQDKWSPCQNVSTILTSIQSLLTDPNPASPANPESAQLYQSDIQAYNRRVRLCVRKSLECAS
jgi:ubiquitin-conjugating enzyme E2 A